ncbi:MAG: gamma-glutamyltransferase [Myxococcales bacterium]|nr:gamma-glutamyltransferase [Myxococcales bacterium]
MKPWHHGLIGWASALLLLSLATAASPAEQAYRFQKFAVAADHELASAAGAEVLRQGGNAADAAAATMLALGVVSPGSSGLGGGGFALYYRASDQSVTFLDFRERAPAAATKTLFEGQTSQGEEPASKPSQLGGLATGVPGEPAGIEELLRRFGKIDRNTVTGPAIRLAEKGFAVGPSFARLAQVFAGQMKRDPLMATWFHKGTIAEGQVIRNAPLGKSLRAFAKSGAAPFYEGWIAKAIVAANRKAGGILTAEDLRAYRVQERKPLDARRLGYRWVTAPPPSAGGYTLLASLQLLDRWTSPDARKNLSGPALYHAFAESWKGPYLDRARYFGDPDFVDVPLEELEDANRTETRAAFYRPTLAMDPLFFEQRLDFAPDEANQPDNAGTSHLCVVDAEGNVASVTTTVNLPFGARYTAAGIVMNDEMDDFASEVGEANAFGLPGGAPNLPEPGKRPVSSMSPTIVFDKDGPLLCVGGSGGSRIITATQQVAWHHLVRGLPVHEAVSHARVHHQGYPNRIRFEEVRPLPIPELQKLTARGHELERSHHNAVVQAIAIDRSTNTLSAASDPRKGGIPAGE